MTSNPPRIRALVVDDEPLARSSLKVLLSRDPQIELLGECESGEQAVAAIRARKPDLVFLDVQMPECDGFDVLELLGAAAPPVIVFVTAYDDHALKAFDAGALDYLVKPFSNERFARMLERVKLRLAATSQAAARPDHLPVKHAGRVVFVTLSEIDWIEAADYYACLHVGEKSYLIRRSLSELAEELDPEAFSRIHRSAIVNLHRVHSLALADDGEYDVQLNGGTKLRLSRRYRKQLQQRLGLAG